MASGGTEVTTSDPVVYQFGSIPRLDLWVAAKWQLSEVQ
jgi:hypothetical protein